MQLTKTNATRDPDQTAMVPTVKLWAPEQQRHDQAITIHTASIRRGHDHGALTHAQPATEIGTDTGNITSAQGLAGTKRQTQLSRWMSIDSGVYGQQVCLWLPSIAIIYTYGT